MQWHYCFRQPFPPAAAAAPTRIGIVLSIHPSNIYLFRIKAAINGQHELHGRRSFAVNNRRRFTAFFLSLGLLARGVQRPQHKTQQTAAFYVLRVNVILTLDVSKPETYQRDGRHVMGPSRRWSTDSGLMDTLKIYVYLLTYSI